MNNTRLRANCKETNSRCFILHSLHGAGSSSKIFWMTVSLVFSPAPAVITAHGATLSDTIVEHISAAHLDLGWGGLIGVSAAKMAFCNARLARFPR
jgi:hypothetical protein